jgi:2-amino-4-hydroxy-6-hydroxymethyldihydropteridine diphosphokinase
MMVEVFVGVGSNIQPRYNIGRGLRWLRSRFGDIRRSPVYSSAAVGFAGNDFLNLVVSFATIEDVPGVVRALHAIEQRAGRERGGGLRSRTLDLDLLLYGDAVIDTPQYALPRPEILDYAFVLKPLADMAGARRHPAIGLTFDTLWAGFSDPDQVLRPVEWRDAQPVPG